MKKTLLYRLFRMGSIPKSLRPTLEVEGITIHDEGMGEWLVSRNLKAFSSPIG